MTDQAKLRELAETVLAEIDIENVTFHTHERGDEVVLHYQAETAGEVTHHAYLASVVTNLTHRADLGDKETCKRLARLITRLLAAADPTTVLSLLDTIAALQAENERLREALSELAEVTDGDDVIGYVRDTARYALEGKDG